jgi:UTP--glucose-1-phosphate uridylyltransferase
VTIAPVRVAVIPAAGLGTRFLPVTKSVPKEMLPIVDRPTIDFVIAEVVAAGVEEVIVVSAPSKEPLDRYFAAAPALEDRLLREGRMSELDLVRRGETMARVKVVHQASPRGNGDAVLCAREAVGDRPFLMIWGDDLAFSAVPVARQLVEARVRQGGGSVAAVMRVAPDAIAKYAAVEGDPAGPRTWRMRRLREKPDPSTVSTDLAQVHGYVLEPSIFDVLADLAPAKGGEVWLADAVDRLARAEPVWAYEFEGERFDTGDRLGYVQAIIAAALDRPDLGGLREWIGERIGSDARERAR